MSLIHYIMPEKAYASLIEEYEDLWKEIEARGKTGEYEPCDSTH